MELHVYLHPDAALMALLEKFVGEQPTPATAPQKTTAEAPKYTKNQLIRAGAELLKSDPSAKEKLRALLEKYNAGAVTDIPDSRVDAFAEDMIAAGAKL